MHGRMKESQGGKIQRLENKEGLMSGARQPLSSDQSCLGPLPSDCFTPCLPSHEYLNGFTGLSCSTVAISLLFPAIFPVGFFLSPTLTSAILNGKPTFLLCILAMQRRIPLSVLPVTPLQIRVLPAPGELVKLAHTLTL